MADNFVTNPAAGGDTFAADDVGGVKWQRVKLGQGVDGSATDVSSASPLPVDTELPAAAALSDSTANPTAPMVGAAGMVYNGASFDRQRGNTEGTLLASAARTTSITSSVTTSHNARTLIALLNVTAAPATAETLQFYLGAYDPATTKTLYSCAPVAITGTEGAKAIGCAWGLGLLSSADNVDGSISGRFRKVYNLPVPRSFVASVFHSGGSSWTYSISYMLTV